MAGQDGADDAGVEGESFGITEAALDRSALGRESSPAPGKVGGREDGSGGERRWSAMVSHIKQSSAGRERGKALVEESGDHPYS